MIYYRRAVRSKMGNTGINRSWLCLVWDFWGDSGTKQQAEFPRYDKWLVDAAFILHLQSCLHAPRFPPRAINCTAGIVILIYLHCTWQIQVTYSGFSTS